jgi:hypothetical protein
MKVFISWSGELSRNVASILRDWLPNVIQIIAPYVSSEDIDKGARWSQDIAGELASSNFGILCITADNIEAPWINFEAGALSKSMENSRVIPFLFDIDRSEIQGPITQFQNVLFERDDFFRLVSSLNRAVEDQSIDETRLSRVFEKWWPDLEKSLKALSEVSRTSRSHLGKPRKQSELLEEILELTRQQNRLLVQQERHAQEFSQASASSLHPYDAADIYIPLLKDFSESLKKTTSFLQYLQKNSFDVDLIKHELTDLDELTERANSLDARLKRRLQRPNL